MLRQTLVAASLLMLAACASTSGGGGGAPSVKDQMAKTVQPGADVLFAVGGQVDPGNGPGAKPTDADGWKKAGDSAKAMKQVADFMIAHPVDQGDWLTAAKQMSTLTDSAAKAANAKDGAKLSQAANDLGDNCTACHSKYKNQHVG